MVTIPSSKMNRQKAYWM